LKIFVIH